ncbi:MULTISPECIES: hypothetical protein [Caproicibacterium]|jgi:hypothetical protein|uniref:Uncharacterized protein n=1 Tax=Caproicibacterium lactatifermentans TaxID=2666138 RepID=A0A859DS67_9FIRM|nr:hypothetical protein [Caproicibacterium lactatifermentans]ARP49950.1 hypothetical protein B6259_03045 [Ruminococcaceae bacterium CPB6]MDD4807674.1 hypothetical protein [Oscillospiraceae bacterium]QKN24329.1 hypothetical protein GJQ69_07425 [Caproicibacterium lactatifermentans]QKO30658.1 hypothetical protein GKP14_06385 [Caproicibacterium lactatifermentans]
MENQNKTYRDMFTLMREEPQAKAYFENLPHTVREQMSTRAFRVNSFDSMQSYAENLTRGDH